MFLSPGDILGKGGKRMKIKIFTAILLCMICLSLTGNPCDLVERTYDRRFSDYATARVFWGDDDSRTIVLSYEVAGLFGALVQCWCENPGA